ncbi:SpoVK/Ycf46/Vps4 family AAA+-type ATPase [Paraburkholderia sp. BL18I3N2]|uniref:AAA family ATPase n=2 Tax=Paraburkholderia TaxID=1822464 RepID=UPI000D05B403|nr:MULTISPECIES: AAA family ATPase [unclassified Paraburkholderia]PRX21757.1 SpoVK/Ycf46/Vps4 family AAA+-type ATPase [Paraburkholderia sp. BL18I3N2]PRX92623.1 SpoVK/Ycf46/Vps4 family AAA+-type ATPase [Paraburkholderia sp. BL25I1N1]
MNQFTDIDHKNLDPVRQQFAWEALAAHFDDRSPEDLTSSQRQFPHHTRPELQQTLSRLLTPFAPRLLGLNQVHERFPLTISSLFVQSTGPMSTTVSLAPVKYRNVDVGEETPVAVLDNGLWLITDGELRAAVLFEQHMEGMNTSIASVEIVSLPNARGLAFGSEVYAGLEQAIRESRLYRGKVLSLEVTEDYSGQPRSIVVHRLPAVERQDVILSPQTMELLDRNIFEFARTREGLKILRQSLQKGVLLYGPPGTGKTHTIKYLASNLPAHTTLLISANQVGQLDNYMLLARLLQPSMVVIEDVDLIGRHRTEMRSPKEESLLNRLLNEMDGLHQDAEILFALTTNRPEEIEEALAARPGRVDQAIEIPAPDADCRARLLRLYGSRMSIPTGVAALAVERTEGVGAAFIKELVRRLAQQSIARKAQGEVSMEDAENALQDMLVRSGYLSQALLGGAPAREKPQVRIVGDQCF